MKMMFLLMSLPMCLSAQIDFLEFINSIDWSSTENDFITKHSLQVKPCKHFYSNYYKTKTDYEIVGINLGNKEYTASIFVDSASLKLNSLFFTIENNQKNKNTLEDALKLSKEMDSLLVSLLGEPDKRMDELNNKYVNSLNRIWYKKNYLIEVLHMFSSDSHLYSLSVKGIENKSADFRVA
ncbi:MAG TPA: hypothetical protein GX007_00190, partial [Bacteroidales bacterium]|nr:hypothetical protein [Bacteroidales bacterium]